MTLTLGTLGAPLSVQAQGPQCDLSRSRQLNSVAAGEVIYIGGPIFTCDNGTTITADSAVYVRSTGRVDFIRNVRFNEAQRALTSMYAQYVGRERRLMAQQNVVLTEKKDGSTLRAPSLDYFQQSAGREARIEIYSGRPHATLYRRRSNDVGVMDTTNVDADRMQIVGENAFKGWGRVDMRRGKLTTNSAYAEFDQSGSYMRLYGRAVVRSDTFRLSADSIDAELLNGDEFKNVRARVDAKLVSNDVDVDAPRLNIDFDDGNVERLIAIGGSRVGANAAQAVARSTDFLLTADSIDARTPGQKVDRVIAIGTARGERALDSADVNLPELIRKDWVRGDTVLAYFGDGTDPERSRTDTTRVRPARGQADTVRVIERIIARGTPASSTYRQREQVAGDSTQLSVNYITAREIDVLLRNGDVDFVRAEGDIRGLYLQPPRRAAAAGDGRRPE